VTEKKPRFDGYVAVDWSAASKPRKGPDSIWVATMYGSRSLMNPRTRTDAMQLVAETLRRANSHKHRLIVGFDFPFGYPSGIAEKLSESGGWRGAWERIAEVIKDDQGSKPNQNNRFDAAGELNRAHFGPDGGPFWGNGLKKDIRGLPRRKPQAFGKELPEEKRFTEKRPLATGSKSPFQLNGAGSVGGQALVGIARLHKLRWECGDLSDTVRIWPFETLGEGQHHVLAEIYPSLIKVDKDDTAHWVKDALQVAVFVEVLRLLDLEGELAPHLRVPESDMPDCVRREEGFILGVEPTGEAGDFNNAAKKFLPCFLWPPEHLTYPEPTRLSPTG